VNKKPVMLDDTCYFLGFDNLPEAIFVWAILNSKSVQQLLASITFLDAKRPYTKDVLMRISIDKVAEAVTFEEIINQIKLLDEKMLINVNKEKWNVFLSMIEKTDLQTKMSFSRYADKAYDYKS
jgi:hypothetical protein